MGNRIVYCEVCGDRIVEADLTSGKAVIVAGRDYCFKCRDKAPKGAHASEAIVPAAQGHRAVDSTRRLAAHVRAAASTHHGTSAPPRGSNTLVVGVVIGGIVALLVVFAMAGGSGPEPTVTRPLQTPIKTTPPDRSVEEAAAAYRRIKDYVQEHPDDVDTIIAKIEAERERLRKTPHWDSVEFLLGQARERKEKRDREKRLDEALAKVTSIENGDPKYEQRPRVQDLFQEARAAAEMIGNAGKSKVEEAERGYERRFHEAGKASSLGLMARAGRLVNQGNFDEALAVLDEFPPSFADTPAAINISSARDQIEEKRRATEHPSPTPAPSQPPMPEWVNDFNRACNAVKADQSEATWKDAAPLIQKAVANIDSAEVGGQLIPIYRFQIRCTGHYFLSMYTSQITKEMDKTLSHLTEALRFGVGKESVEYVEKQPQLANFRKDARYKPFIEKYTKKYVDSNRRWLAVTAVELFPQEFERRGLGADEGGFVVAGVIPEMTGAKLGLQPGDTVISFGGEKLPRVGAYAKLDELLEKTKPGTDYPLLIRRISNGERVSLTVRW